MEAAGTRAPKPIDEVPPEHEMKGHVVSWNQDERFLPSAVSEVRLARKQPPGRRAEFLGPFCARIAAASLQDMLFWLVTPRMRRRTNLARIMLSREQAPALKAGYLEKRVASRMISWRSR
jgi:hypothetical protein